MGRTLVELSSGNVMYCADNGGSPLMCLKGGGITEKQLSHCSEFCDL